MKPTTEICPGCGSALPAGSTECPSCSKSTVAEPDRESSEDFSKLYPSEGPLFECGPCERLVEAQNHHGRVIVPRFCPWCGGEVLSLIGKEMDGYRIDRLLAEGGFGVLYLASNVAEAKMKMVVKFLRPQMGYLRPELVRVFVEEARLTEEIGRSCWNVARVHSVRDEPWPYFMEEYIRGTTLQQAINAKDDGAMDLAECKGYLRGMAKALVATHEHGRVHRDLKPQNVMVIEGKDLPENRVKLLDFGLSLKIAGANNSLALKQLSASSSGEPTRSPLDVAGTPEYMPPEAFDGMNDFTGDVYSFGVTAYEVLTGQGPWEEPPPGVDRFFYWRDAHKSKAPRSLRDLRAEVPGWLAKVIAKCLEKDKANRIATAQELLHELREPIPFWVKPVSAAAIICVAVLAYFAFFRPPAAQTLELSENKAPLDRSILWVPAVEKLKDRRISARVPGKTITVNGCRASDSRVLTDFSTGAIEITFSGDEDLRSLIGERVTISGSGEMEEETIRFEGALQVRVDATKPRISAVTLHHESSGDPPALRAGLRLRSSVCLSVDVEEDHPWGARLEAKRLGPISSPLARSLELSGTPTRSEGSSKVTYGFALPGEPSAYRVQIVALDHAGNRDSTPSVDLTVDDEVDLSIPIEDRQSYVARGKAFYEIQTREVLQGFEARSKKDGRRLDTEVYERPLGSGEVSSLSLAKLLSKGKLIKVDAADVKEGQYLLAVTPGTEGDAPFELHVRDTAFPQNELTEASRQFLLPYEPLVSLRPEDVRGVSVEFLEGEIVTLTREAPREGVEFRLGQPRKSSRVKNIFINVAAERFQSASCKAFQRREVTSEDTGDAHGQLRWEGECHDDMEPTRVVFSPGDLLLEEKDTIFVIDLRDGLGAAQIATLVLTTDTRPPELDVKVTSAQRGEKYFNVTHWDGLRLEVRAHEPLQSATASLLGKDLHPAASSGDARVWEFLFRLPGDVMCVDGKHMVRVEGVDLAGNRTPRNVSFTINGRPPVVSLVGDDSELEDIAQLTSDSLVLKIEDGNGLRYDDARVSIEHWTDADPSRQKARDIPIRKPAPRVGSYGEPDRARYAPHLSWRDHRTDSGCARESRCLEEALRDAKSDTSPQGLGDRSWARVGEDPGRPASDLHDPVRGLHGRVQCPGLHRERPLPG